MRQAIREFIGSLSTNLKHLLDYLISVKREQVLKQQFEQINHRSEFLAFKDMF